MKTKRRKKKGTPTDRKPTFKTSRFGRLKESFSSHPKLFALVLLSLLGTLLYINSIHNEFVFDDIPYIPQNKSIRSFRNVPDILGITSGSPHYRPVRALSYVIDYQLTGLNPIGYHFFNIFYHILTSFLVFLITSIISKNGKVALVTSLLFTAHPIQTETVAYMAGRRDILSALFFLMGFYFFLKQRQSPSPKYLFLIFLSYILSIFSKEMGVTLPALLLLYDLMRKSPDVNTEARTFCDLPKGLMIKIKEVFKRYWTFYVPLFLIAILFIFYQAILKNPSREQGQPTVSINFLTVFGIWVFYIKMLILPISLNVAHSFPISKSVLEFRTFLSALIVLAIFVLLIKLLKKKELYSFSGFWFFITLLPVSHIIPHHELLAEHFLYLPSFGFSFAAGLLHRDLFQKIRWKPFLLIFLIALLFFYSYKTIERNPDWKNELVLWSDAAKKSPDNVRAHTNLISAYIRYGDYDQAISVSLEMLKRHPLNYEIYDKLGVSYMLKGDYNKAIEKLRTSVQIRSDNPMAYNNLGIIYLGKKDFEQAVAEFRKAIVLRRDYAEAHNNLANAFAMKGLLDQAVDEEIKAINIDPSMPGYRFNLARLYENKGWINESVKEYKESLKLNPGFSDAHYYLGMALSKMENHTEAILEFEKATKSNPSSGKAYFMLGMSFNKVGDKEKAISNFQKALLRTSNEKEKERIQSILSQLGSTHR